MWVNVLNVGFVKKWASRMQERWILNFSLRGCPYLTPPESSFEGGGLFKVLPSLVTDIMVLPSHLNATYSYSIEVNEGFMLLLQRVPKGTNVLPWYLRIIGSWNKCSYMLSWPSYWCVVPMRVLAKNLVQWLPLKCNLMSNPIQPPCKVTYTPGLVLVRILIERPLSNEPFVHV